MKNVIAGVGAILLFFGILFSSVILVSIGGGSLLFSIVILPIAQMNTRLRKAKEKSNLKEQIRYLRNN